MAVLKISFPVIIIDEVLKFIARKFAEGKQWWHAPFSRDGLHAVVVACVLYALVIVYCV